MVVVGQGGVHPLGGATFRQSVDGLFADPQHVLELFHLVLESRVLLGEGLVFFVLAGVNHKGLYVYRLMPLDI